MFMQLCDRMEPGHNGLGIGLTQVEQLVEMHGGTIAVESERADRGSTFRVTLPIRVSLSQQSTAPSAGNVGEATAGPSRALAALPQETTIARRSLGVPRHSSAPVSSAYSSIPVKQ